MATESRVSLLAPEAKAHRPCVDFSTHTPPSRSRLNPAWVCRGHPGIRLEDLQQKPDRR